MIKRTILSIKNCALSASNAGLYLAVGLGILSVAIAQSARAQNIYAANYNSSAISEFTSTGSFIRTFSSGGGQAVGLAFNSAGDLFVANRGNFGGSQGIMEFGQDGTSLGTFASISSPEYLAFDAAGNLFVGQIYSSDIVKITPTGVQTTFANSSDSINNPEGLAFDSSGNLYVANRGSGTVTKYSSTGAYLGVFANLSGNTPSSIAFDANGNLDVALDFNGTIDQIAPNGTIKQFTSSYNRPGGMAFSSSGSLFVADFGDNGGGGNAVAQYSPSGNLISSFTSQYLDGAAGLAISNSTLLPVSSGASAPEHDAILYLLSGAFITVGACKAKLRLRRN